MFKVTTLLGYVSTLSSLALARPNIFFPEVDHPGRAVRRPANAVAALSRHDLLAVIFLMGPRQWDTINH